MSAFDLKRTWQFARNSVMKASCHDFRSAGARKRLNSRPHHQLCNCANGGGLTDHMASETPTGGASRHSNVVLSPKRAEFPARLTSAITRRGRIQSYQLYVMAQECRFRDVRYAFASYCLEESKRRPRKAEPPIEAVCINASLGAGELEARAMMLAREVDRRREQPLT
jgi:hypothetical protein